MIDTEENVCEETTPAGQSAEAEREKGPTALGKFKDVNALLEAYGALEAEFTRRSQRLKALEKEAENLRQERTNGEKTLVSEAEKPAEKSAVPSGNVQTEGGENAKDGEAGNIAAPKTSRLTEGIRPALEPIVQDLGQGEGEGKSVPLSEEEIFKAVAENESVKRRIIGEYLSSLSKSDAPLVRGGTATLVLSPAKPASVEEAGRMALRYFRGGKG